MCEDKRSKYGEKMAAGGSHGGVQSKTAAPSAVDAASLGRVPTSLSEQHQFDLNGFRGRCSSRSIPGVCGTRVSRHVRKQ